MTITTESDELFSRLLSLAAESQEKIHALVVSDRGDLARQLLGAGRRFAPERDAVAELVAERAIEDHAPTT